MSRAQHVTGKVAEFLAAAFFASHGWEVWWPTTTQNRADFLIEDGRDVHKVQVKKATWSGSGPNRYLSVRLTSRNNTRYSPEDFSKLFIVDDDRRMWVVPHEEIYGLSSIQLDKRGPTSGKKAYTRSLYNPDTWRVA